MISFEDLVVTENEKPNEEKIRDLYEARDLNVKTISFKRSMTYIFSEWLAFAISIILILVTFRILYSMWKRNLSGRD